MVHTHTLAVVAAALLAAIPVNAGLYPKSSKVLQVDGKSYDRLIAQSNYTSVSNTHQLQDSTPLTPSRLLNSMPLGADIAKTCSPPTRKRLRTSKALRK